MLFVCVGTLDQDHIVRWSYSFVSYFHLTQALAYNTIRHITQDMKSSHGYHLRKLGPNHTAASPTPATPASSGARSVRRAPLAVPGGIASTAAPPSPPIRVSHSSEPYWQALSDLATAAAVGIVLAATHSFYLYGSSNLLLYNPGYRPCRHCCASGTSCVAFLQHSRRRIELLQ